MTRRARHLTTLLLLSSCALASCAGGEGNRPKVELGKPVDINGDGEFDGIATDLDGDGVADSVDLDGDETPDALLPGVEPPNSGGDGDGDGDTSEPGDGDTGDGDGPPKGDGDGDVGPAPGDGDAPLPDVQIPLAKVPCGASECEIREDNLCCESWNAGSGFGTNPMCITEDACIISPSLNEPEDEGLYSPVGYLFTRAVTSTCDGAEDCKTGHVCCYVRQGSPITEDPFAAMIVWTGPGAGRQCMATADCMNFGAANGVPTGLVSCNDNPDCQLIAGTSCQPEQDNTASTGKNHKARAGFKVCR